MTLLILAFCIVCLILLITWGKVNPFLAFLLVSILAALLLGIPINKIARSVDKGIGDTLGSLVIVIVLGAMLGKLVAESGAAQKIANTLRNVFGYKNLSWAMSLTGFIVGIPLKRFPWWPQASTTKDTLRAAKRRPMGVVMLPCTRMGG